jgi:chromosome segregation ATPase
MAARLGDAQQQLGDVNRQVTDAAAQADVVIAELRAHIDALQHDLRASEACTDQHSRRCASLEDSVKQLTLEMTGMEQELADAVAAGSKVSAQRDALEGELCTLNAARDELNSRLSTCSAALTASEAAARVVGLERDSMAARLGDAQQQLGDVNMQMKDFEVLLQSQVDEYKILFQDTQDAARNYMTFYHMFDSCLSEAQQQLIDSKQQLLDAAAQADAMFAEQRAQIYTLQQECIASTRP